MIATDASIAAEVERMVSQWKTAGPEQRRRYRDSLRRAADWWSTLPADQREAQENRRRDAIRVSVQAAVDRLDAMERAADAKRQAEVDRARRLEAARFREGERRHAAEAWIRENVPAEFRAPLDLANPRLREKANIDAVRFILRDGVPLDVPDSAVEAWKDAHDAGIDYACNWFIFGGSGTRKTGLVWQLAAEYVRDYYEDDALSGVVFLAFSDWATTYGHAQASAEDRRSYGAMIRDAELVVIDEFEPQMTEPRARGFLELLKARFDNRRRLIITSMFSLQECCDRWAEDPRLRRWGEAIRRRLVDDKYMVGVCLDKEDTSGDAP